MESQKIEKTAENLGKGMLVVLFANIINLILSLIRSFLLPKYLSVPAYADIKSYQLYTSYAGLVTFGYIDGMYLRYGGRNLESIDFDSFVKNLSTFRFMMIGASVIVAGIGILIDDMILTAMGISIIALKGIDYFQSFFQAVGKFSLYSVIMNISTAAMFLVNVVLLFVLRKTESYYYICAYVLVYYLIWILLELAVNKKIGIKNSWRYFSVKECKESISCGFILMCGAILSVFMMGMDRWCVKITMDTYSFAAYSFAASSVGFLSYAISPVAVTLYNYFCKISETGQYIKCKNLIVAFSGLIIAAAFPIKFILEVYLQKYLPSSKVMFILFASQFITAIILCFYVNLYKAKKMQTKYFKGIILTVIIGILFNIVLYYIFRVPEAFAWGTLITMIIWLVMCCVDFKEYKISGKELVYIAVLSSLFLACGLNLKSYWGLIIYMIGYSVFSFIVMKTEFIQLISIAKNKLIK